MVRPQVSSKALLAAVLCAIASSHAQDTTIRSNTELVLVPVVVKNHLGRTVSGLKVSDFTILVDQKPQPVAQFEEVQNHVTAANATAQVRSGEYSNAALRGSSPIGLTIILLDLVNTPLLDQSRARSQLIDFLSTALPPQQFLTVLALTPSGLRQIHDFTNDNAELIASLRNTHSELNRLSGTNGDLTDHATAARMGTREGEMGLSRVVEQEYRNFMIADQRQLTMEAMVQVAQAFKSIPGRKNLVWTTAGFPFYLYDPGSLAEMTFGSSPNYESVWRELNDANISVYPVDVRGVFDPLWDAEFSPEHGFFNAPGAESATFSFWSSLSTMRNFADATGGKACLSQNEMARCYADSLQDASDYYLIDFYVPPDRRTPGWHKLKVKVNGDYDVRARRGFTIGDAGAHGVSPLDVVEALRSPIENTGVQFSVELGEPVLLSESRRMLSVAGVQQKPRPKGSKVPVATVPFKITIAKNSLLVDAQQQNRLVLRVDAAAVTEKNEVLSLFSKAITTNLTADGVAKFRDVEFTFTDKIAVPAGRLRVRFAVVDVIGRKLGTVEAPLMVKAEK